MNLRIALLPLAFATAAFAQTTPAPLRPAPHTMVLTSPAFEQGGVIPNKNGNTTPPAAPGSTPAPAPFVPSPQLVWKDAPAGTASFVVTCIDDEYAPQRNSGPWYHWIIFNIPATAKGLPEGVPLDKQLPDGSIQPVRGKLIGYLAPAAPINALPHHYVFRVIALDTKLSLTADATADEINKAMDGHILDRALLVGSYRKPQ